MKFGFGKRAVLLTCAVILLVITLKLPAVWKWLYPIYYPDIILKNAIEYKQDPNLILAIIQTESKFMDHKTSKKGAIGLMQIMSDTADWILMQGRYPAHFRNSLHDPAINIELGSWYLRYLMNKYDNNLIVVLAAYNAGQGNVSRWLESGIWDGRLETLKQVPYGETRHYIQRVLYTYKRYEQIYSVDAWQIKS